MTFLARVADLVLNQPLLLTPDKAEVIAAVLGGRIGIDGPDLSRFEGSPLVFDQDGRARMRPFNVSGQTAVITVTGSLVNRGAWVGANSGLTSYEGIQHQLKQAEAADEVRSIILDLHTPGGEAVGAFETADMVRALAQKKRVIAVVNGVAASAGYAIASGASEIVVTPSGVAGSIGVISLHVDASGQLEQKGLKPTLIIAGTHKADGHPFGPLPEDVRADFQARVDGIYEQFLATVAAGRGERLTIDMARATQARTYIGQAAVDVGLADRVGTFESVLADLSRANGRNPSMKGNTSMKETTEAGQTTAAETTTTVAALAAPVDLQAAIAAERTRMAGLDTLASKLNGQADGLKIIAAAKLDGSSAGDAALKLFAEGVVDKIVALGGLKADDATAAGVVPAAAADSTETTQASTPEGWKAEYEKSAALQAEFGSSAQYVAYKRAEAGGRVRVMGAKK
jgi:signal peptide peptidase SppA